MNKKTITLFSILISALFVLAIVSMTIGILFDSKQGALGAQADFNIFITEVQSICSTPQTTQQMYTQIQKCALNKPDFASVSLTDYGQTILLTSNRLVSTSSPFIKTYSLSVLEQSGRQIAVTASIITLKNIDIFSRARTAFLLVLAGTLITAIFIIYLSLTEKETSQETDISENKSIPDTNTDQSALYNSTVLSAQSTASSINTTENAEEDENKYVKADAHIVHYDAELPALDEDESPVQEQEESITSLENQNSFSAAAEEIAEPDDNESFGEYASISETDSCDAETEAENIEYIPTAETTENTVSVQSEPEEKHILDDNDLPTSRDTDEDIIPDPYSSVSGFMREPLLEHKLDIILNEAAASQDDVTLAIIQVANLEYNSETARSVYTILEHYFEHKENIFEYGEDCFAGIFIGKDTDESLAIAEQIYSDITAVINAAPEDNLYVLAGLSSRALRLIPSRRLVLEATEALRHAEKDPDSPIIAFRVDPEKYRQYIAAAQESAQNQTEAIPQETVSN